MRKYLPEGKLIETEENAVYLKDELSMEQACRSGAVLEAVATVCDNAHNLKVKLPTGTGIIPRAEGALGIAEGRTKDIALLSKVGKPVCFKILRTERTAEGENRYILSRRLAQEECERSYISGLRAGDIIDARVTHLEQFGCFADIGCGIVSMIPIDAISVSRISHPSDRFYNGQDIKAVVKSTDGQRICLSHKELLGSWQENADMFSAGETVGGIVRSVEEYGIFVELAPNLAGLAEPRAGIRAGQSASVYIKAIIPDRMKIKLIIVDTFERDYTPERLNYFIASGRIDRWEYSTPNSGKSIVSEFM